jgi:hypothetical protein
MDEVRFGIITHATPTEMAGYVPQFGGLNAGDADIYGLAEHMATFLGNTPAFFSQFSICSGRPISGYDVEARCIADPATNRVEEIDEPGSNRFYFSCAVVP